MTATLLCVWAAGYHTPAGALVRDLVARARGTASTTRPLLAYYSGGAYEGREAELPAPQVELPVGVVAEPGPALGRGAWAVLATVDGPRRAVADELAKKFDASLNDPDGVAALLEHARGPLGSDDAAILALFCGYDVASYAVARAHAEGRSAAFEDLLRQLPPGAAGTQQASTALTFGTAYALSWPVAPGTRVSSPFGWRDHPILGRGQLHTGVDLSVPEGTPIKVVAAGTVTRASEDAVNGRVVIVDHGRGVMTAYCHNSRLLVTVGQRVSAGEVISESGTTGRSTGPHLHYQLELGRKPVDPFVFRGRGAGALPEVGKGLVGTGSSPLPDPHQALKKAFDQFARPADTEE